VKTVLFRFNLEFNGLPPFACMNVLFKKSRNLAEPDFGINYVIIQLILRGSVLIIIELQGIKAMCYFVVPKHVRKDEGGYSQ